MHRARPEGSGAGRERVRERHLGCPVVGGSIPARVDDDGAHVKLGDSSGFGDSLGDSPGRFPRRVRRQVRRERVVVRGEQAPAPALRHRGRDGVRDGVPVRRRRSATQLVDHEQTPVGRRVERRRRVRHLREKDGNPGPDPVPRAHAAVYRVDDVQLARGRGNATADVRGDDGERNLPKKRRLAPHVGPGEEHRRRVAAAAAQRDVVANERAVVLRGFNQRVPAAFQRQTVASGAAVVAVAVVAVPFARFQENRPAKPTGPAARAAGDAITPRSRAHGERLQHVQIRGRAHHLPPLVAALREIRHRRGRPSSRRSRCESDGGEGARLVPLFVEAEGVAEGVVEREALTGRWKRGEVAESAAALFEDPSDLGARALLRRFCFRSLLPSLLISGLPRSLPRIELALGLGRPGLVRSSVYARRVLAGAREPRAERARGGRRPLAQLAKIRE